MLQEAFYWLFNMSIIATITGAIIMLIRQVKKIPKRVVVFLWFIPFLRMIIPFGLNSPYSLLTLLSKITTKTIIVYQPTDTFAFSVTNSIRVANRYFPMTFKKDIFHTIFHVSSIIWLIVFLTILFILIVIYCTTLHEMKRAKHFRENIYFSDQITSPAVYGIMKPKIILPYFYEQKDMELILLHERIHIRRADNFWRLFAFLIVAVHWFNPLSWLFLKLFLSDLELSCDEYVLVKLGSGRMKEYALSLLKSKENANMFSSAFGGGKTKTRIENILSFKKMTCFSFAFFLAFIAVMFFVLLTNAA